MNAACDKSLACFKPGCHAMSIDWDALRLLPASEKLQLVEILWDDLGGSTDPIPLPDWVDREAIRRRREMNDSSVGLTHDEAWRRIERRHG
jgi:hypothetical protein